VIEAVLNVSEGRDEAVIADIGATAGQSLLDVHSDPHHHRSVFTLAGKPARVEESAFALAVRAAELLDFSLHEGVHPRLGIVDVVPFVPYGTPFAVAVRARDAFVARWAAHGVPCFVYGPERSLPDVRRQAFVTLAPDAGPATPHPRAGATCVGARPVLVAYNLVVDADLPAARDIARAMRGPSVRAFGFALGEESQVSFNLLEPEVIGPAEVFDLVARVAAVKSAELVGLLPGSILEAIPERRWASLGLHRSKTVEARLASAAGPAGAAAS
jgi:glutamate formiminotransferase